MVSVSEEVVGGGRRTACGIQNGKKAAANGEDR